MRLESDTASATFCLSRGGRLASLVVHGHEVLITAGDEQQFGWGAFPMVPFAGRVVGARFRFEGDEHQLPVVRAPHAIHGTAWNRSWNRVDHRTMAVDLGAEWPFGGDVVQTADLDDDHLELSLTVTAGDRAMPAMVGWHPSFRRRLLRHSEAPVDYAFDLGSMYERNEAMVPSGRLVPPSPGPWDDCFTGVSEPLVLTWPGLVELSLTSSCDHWVIFDRRSHLVCVEPQSDAPDAFNRAPLVLGPGESLTETFRISWRLLGDGR